MALSANVGGKPKAPLKQNTNSNRLVLFTTLLVGTIIWIGYRASITSELSSIKVVYPFNDLETLLDTDYQLKVHSLFHLAKNNNNDVVHRLLTFSRGGHTADLFEKGKEDGIFARVYKNNMDQDSSFGPIDKGLARVVDSKEKLAGFFSLDYILQMEQYQCKVKSNPFYWISKVRIQ